VGEAQLVVDPPASALAVFAHPDCPIVNCGGALARWARQDCRTHLVVVTRGERGGRDVDATDEEVMARRAALLQQSAGRLGLTSVEILDFPDGELVNDLSLRRAIVAAIRDVRPEAVLFHDPTAVIYGDRYVSHPDHRAVGWAALDAVGAPSSGARYHPDLGPPHRVTHAYLCGSLEPDTFVDIGPVVAVKAAALRDHADEAHSSDWIDDAVRARAEEAGEMAGVTHAEGFRRLMLL
jgi:LmbE family N-acetylglucosaminyl deacetylase